jgi:hypothetical protein
VKTIRLRSNSLLVHENCSTISLQLRLKKFPSSKKILNLNYLVLFFLSISPNISPILCFFFICKFFLSLKKKIKPWGVILVHFASCAPSQIIINWNSYFFNFQFGHQFLFAQLNYFEPKLIANYTLLYFKKWWN